MNIERAVEVVQAFTEEGASVSVFPKNREGLPAQWNWLVEIDLRGAAATPDLRNIVARMEQLDLNGNLEDGRILLKG